MERILGWHQLLLWHHHLTIHLQDHLSSCFYRWQVIKQTDCGDNIYLFFFLHSNDMSLSPRQWKTEQTISLFAGGARSGFKHSCYSSWAIDGYCLSSCKPSSLYFILAKCSDFSSGHDGSKAV